MRMNQPTPPFQVVSPAYFRLRPGWRAGASPALLAWLLFGLVGPVGLSQETSDDRWHPISPEASRMRIAMPGEPKFTAPVIKPLPDKEVTVHLAMVTQNEGKSLFLVGYHDLDFLPEGEQKKNDVLEGGVKGTVLNTLGKLTKHESIKIGDHPGRNFEYSGHRFGQDVKGVSRIYLVGSRVYQLTVLFTPDLDLTADAEKFFGSFELLPGDEPTPK